MVIKIAEISQDIDTLTEEAQILLLDFIQLLKKRYPKPENQLIENEMENEKQNLEKQDNQ
ncbi:MAG: hypothetical protein HEQ33_21775 [Dolichospermum sp. WA123]|nr:hypothetical protein [Dolichospermum sp. WA123]